jgi:hypothetical protein
MSDPVPPGAEPGRPALQAEPLLGWRAREVEQELPGLQLMLADVQVVRRAWMSPGELPVSGPRLAT